MVSRRGIGQKLATATAAGIERAFLPLDKALMRRNRNLAYVPHIRHRRGGKLSYGEWCWLIGMLQTIIHELIGTIEAPRVVDVGCGTGLAMIAAEPLVGDRGDLLGLDVSQQDIDFCRRHYPDPPFRFAHLTARNDLYAPTGFGTTTWPVDDRVADLVTAVSLWTHLQESDAVESLAEAGRVLRPGGHLLLSAFVIDPDSKDQTSPDRSRYHRTAPKTWRFDRPLGNGWFSPSWADPPERAVAITRQALTDAAVTSGLDMIKIIPGTWPERPGLYFQDLVLLQSIDR